MVTDLSQDSRFNQLPFVAGPPSFKYYAGTPLTTNKGINIGSLFILDNVVRPPLTADQQSFLGSVAQIIMKHMEVGREAQERKKAMRMSRGLNAFVEGRAYLSNEEYLPGSFHVGHGEERGPAATHPVELPRGMKLSTEQDTSQSESDADISKENVKTSHKATIARAADLLRQSLDLQSGGGVVYFDTTLGFSGRAEELPTSPTMQDTAANVDFEDESPKAVRRNSLISNPTAFRHGNFDGISEAQKTEKVADIISFSMSRPVIGSPHEAREPASFNPLGEGSLQYLLKRHPRGKLWSFDEDGSLTSSEEEFAPNEETTSSHRHSRMQRRQYIARMLLKHFPGGEDPNSLSVDNKSTHVRCSPTNTFCAVMGFWSFTMVCWLLHF